MKLDLEAALVRNYGLLKAAQDDGCAWPDSRSGCKSGEDCNCLPMREMVTQARKDVERAITAPTQGTAQPDLTDEEIAMLERDWPLTVAYARQFKRLLAEVKRRRALVPPAAEPLAPPAAPAGQQPTRRCAFLVGVESLRVPCGRHLPCAAHPQEQLGRKEGA